MMRVGQTLVTDKKETSRRFDTKQHKAYGGIDLHARSMSMCILSQDGEMLLHRTMQTRPEMFLKALASYREDLVVAVECLFPWYWLADLCAREAMPFVLGHALSMQAIHGGTAKNDTIDAQKIAVLLRGGMLPQAYVYPADMRATRDLLRRRIHLVRKRAELCTHVQQTNRQYNLPEIGTDIASKTNRPGVADAKIGKASLTWAFSAAAGLLLRAHPAGQQYLARLENKHGKGKAL